jgi:CspA family cold shock protein
MATEKIVRWIDEKGFGFIERDNGGDNIFVHIRDVDGSADALDIGQKVEFNEAVDKRRGKPEAKNVILI